MTKIDLYFGTPISEKASEQNETCALNHEISIEKANIELFNLMTEEERKEVLFEESFVLSIERFNSFQNKVGYQMAQPLTPLEKCKATSQEQKIIA
jgi:hypothetical protein